MTDQDDGYTVTIPRPPLTGFTLPLTAVLGAMFGFVAGNVYGQPPGLVRLSAR